MISIIIPVFNRERNIALTLTALKNQTLKGFEVIVVDDGSTDKTAEVVKGFDAKYLYLGENKGYRQSRARNEGAKIASGEVFLFLDSDVLLPPNALELFMEDYEEEPNRVICGRYEWGNPIEITVDDVNNNFTKIINEELPIIENAEAHGMQGIPDIRDLMFNEFPVGKLCFETGHYLGAFGGNILVPNNIFKEIGLYNKAYNPSVNDEACGYDQYFTAPIEDGDFGLSLRDVGYPISFDNRIKGYHIWHPRNISEIQKVSAEQIPYLDKKHHIDVVKKTQQTYRSWLKDEKEKKL